MNLVSLWIIFLLTLSTSCYPLCYKVSKIKTLICLLLVLFICIINLTLPIPSSKALTSFLLLFYNTILAFCFNLFHEQNSELHILFLPAVIVILYMPVKLCSTCKIWTCIFGYCYFWIPCFYAVMLCMYDTDFVTDLALMFFKGIQIVVAC